MTVRAKIFFSYARANAGFVLKLAMDLRSAGIDLWLDQLDIIAGARWDTSIQEALERCEALIVVLSPESVKSHNVLDEVSYALEEGKRVIPVLLDPCDIPFRLRRVQYIDFTGDYQAGLRALSTGVQSTRGSVSPRETTARERATGDEGTTQKLARLAHAEHERLAAKSDRRSVPRPARDAAEKQKAAPRATKPPRVAKSPPPQTRATRPTPKARAPRRPLLAALASLAVLALVVGVYWGIYHPGADTDQVPSSGADQVASSGAGQVPSSSAGQVPSSGAGQVPSSGAGQVPSSGAGQVPSSGAGQVPSSGAGQVPSSGAGQVSSSGADQVPSSGADQVPSSGADQVASSDADQVASSAEAKIQQLLATAERNLQQGRLDSPKENNAVEGFRVVLALDPDNQAALAGLDGVLGQYLVLANDALDEQQLEKAEMYLAKVTRIAPASAEVLDIRTRIAKARVATQGREKIQRLLAEAENNLQNDRLTSPKGNNATERYRAVLDLDPGNQDARAGLDRVVSRYIVLVNSAMDGQKLDKAEAYLAKAARIAPTNAELVNIRARIEKARVTDKKRKDIELLLVTAEGDLQQGRLDSPTGSNAVEGYRSVLAIDPDNQAAREGLHRVAGRYLELANRSLVDRDLDRAAGYVVKAEGIEANNPALAELRAELEKARAAASRLAFAVFPFHTFAICHYPVGDEVTDATEAVIRKQPRAKLQYSYYEEGADASVIPGMHELWSKNVVRRKPMLDIVRKVGRKLGVNGVLMAWYKCSRSQYMSEDTYEVEVYLIDVNRNQVFHAKENFLDAKRAVSSVFGEFFAAYGVASG